MSGKCKKGETTHAPTAVESTLAWIVGGPIEGLPCKSTQSMLSTERIDPVTHNLRQFWELKCIGIVDKGDVHMSLEEEESVRQFNEGLKFDGELYEVPLLWKSDAPPLKSNYLRAVKRLEGVERQLRRVPERANAYKDAMNQYVEKGFAVEVKKTVDGNEKVSYLPHHAVFREDKKTTKCRVVLDASAYDEHEVSLNDCICSGPALQPNLVSVLLRFRARRIALMADVEKMFLQIKVDERDQDALRYLWRDLKSDEPPRVHKLQRLAFGVSCGPFLAIATIQSHAKKCSEEFHDASREAMSNKYVDDYLSGADDVEATVKLQQSLDKMMERGGFNLTKWTSSSKEVLSHIDEQEQAESRTVDFNAIEPLKALGICWDTLPDCFLFSVPPDMLAVSDPETKRSLLSIACRVLDHVGLITPSTIRAKMLFQELWQRGLQWEDRLDEDIADLWRSWKSELSQLSRITIPRYFMENIESSCSIELHGFGDASPTA